MIDWLFDRFLPGAARALLLLLLFSPCIVALVLRVEPMLPPLPLGDGPSLMLTRLDSALQLGIGSYVARAAVLALLVLLLLIGLPVPRAARRLWRAGLLFQIFSFLSAACSSHPFDALTTALDVALLQVVALLCCWCSPSRWVPRTLAMSAVGVGALAVSAHLDRLLREGGPLRLDGPFHQPNITACYLLCAIPWLLGQETRQRNYPALRLGAWLGLIVCLLGLVWTGTRAAWFSCLLLFFCRWWLPTLLPSTASAAPPADLESRFLPKATTGAPAESAGPVGQPEGPLVPAAAPPAEDEADELPHPFHQEGGPAFMEAERPYFISRQSGQSGQSGSSGSSDSSGASFALAGTALAALLFAGALVASLRLGLPGVVLLAAVLTGFCWLSGRRGVALVCLLLALGAVGAIDGAVRSVTASPGGPDARLENLAAGRDISLDARLEFWRSALEMGIHFPWTGVGPKGYHRYYPSFQTDERWFSKFAHSAPLTVWAELGVPGTLAFVWFVVLSLATVVRALPAAEPERRTRILDGSTGCLALALCASVDVQWQFPLIIITWAAWYGYTLGQCLPPGWRDQILEPPPVETVSTWTLRPRVILLYGWLVGASVLFALNLAWGGAEMFNELGDYYTQNNHGEEAVRANRTAVFLNPFQGSYFHQLGLALQAANPTPEEKTRKNMLEVALRATALDSHRAVHWDLLSKVQRLNGLAEDARQSLRHALECDSINYPSFYTSMAESLKPNGPGSQKLLLLEACLQRFPPEAQQVMFDFRSRDIDKQRTMLLLLLAEQARPADHPDLALTFYNMLLKMNPKDPNGRLGRIVCLTNLQHYATAMKEAEAFYRTDPSPEVDYVLANLRKLPPNLRNRP